MCFERIIDLSIYRIQRTNGLIDSYSKLKEFGLKPIKEHVADGYKATKYDLYRHEDLPPVMKKFPIYRRKKGETAWQKEQGVFTFEGKLFAVPVRALTFWLPNPVWEDVDDLMPVSKESPVNVIKDEEENLYCITGSFLTRGGRIFRTLHLMASTNRGRTWKRRGAIADATELCKGGYWEESMTIVPNGDLVCVSRTLNSNDENELRELYMTRSSDKGYTWSYPRAIAPYSVTPHLIPLKRGITALIYGRPGVHLLFSTDNCNSWNTHIILIGSEEDDLKKEAVKKGLKDWWNLRFRDSCSNTSYVKLGPDRFLVAYSDFQYTDEAEVCKAIKVQEITATAK